MNKVCVDQSKRVVKVKIKNLSISTEDIRGRSDGDDGARVIWHPVFVFLRKIFELMWVPEKAESGYSGPLAARGQLLHAAAGGGQAGARRQPGRLQLGAHAGAHVRAPGRRAGLPSFRLNQY